MPPPPHCFFVWLSVHKQKPFFQPLLPMWALLWHFICVCLCHTRLPSLNFFSICTSGAQCGFSNSHCIDVILFVLFMSLQHTKFLCKRKNVSFLHLAFTSTTTGCATIQVVTAWPVTVRVRFSANVFCGWLSDTATDVSQNASNTPSVLHTHALICQWHYVILALNSVIKFHT